MKWDFGALYQDLVVCVCVFFNSLVGAWAACVSTGVNASAHWPALQIHSRYPLSSLSICCCLLSLRNSLLFSTRSLSLANSLWEHLSFIFFTIHGTKVQNINYCGKKTKLNCFCKTNGRLLPWEYTQHQVEHEEGADDDEGDVVHPIKVTATYIVTLQETHGHTSVMHCWFNFPLLFFCRECQLRLF